MHKHLFEDVRVSIRNRHIVIEAEATVSFYDHGDSGEPIFAQLHRLTIESVEDLGGNTAAEITLHDLIGAAEAEVLEHADVRKYADEWDHRPDPDPIDYSGDPYEGRRGMGNITGGAR